jgi:hypothetical protein
LKEITGPTPPTLCGVGAICRAAQLPDRGADVTLWPKVFQGFELIEYFRDQINAKTRDHSQLAFKVRKAMTNPVETLLAILFQSLVCAHG